MDIDHEQLPNWINWLAQDADGCWWGYQVEPLQHHQGWYENEVGQIIKLQQTQANSLWKDTLVRVSDLKEKIGVRK